MQNLVLYYLISGPIWFICGLLVLLIVVLDLRGAFLSRSLLRRLVNILLPALMTLAALSGTPVVMWLLVPLVAACVGYVFVGFASPRAKVRYALGGLTGILVATTLVLEVPYHMNAAPATARPAHLYIIGDSLAAGVGGEKSRWPTHLQHLTDIRITDLSFAGANAQSARRRQANVIEREQDQTAWVLICIGGNDMLGGTRAADFGRHLDDLLATARGDASNPRTVLMLELPIVPGAWAFSAWQRELAAKHNVILIPRWILAEVVLTDANVIDGLHLSARGHERMAELLMPWLGAARQ